MSVRMRRIHGTTEGNREDVGCQANHRVDDDDNSIDRRYEQNIVSPCFMSSPI